MKKIICNNKLLNSKCIFGILLFGVCLFSVSCDDKDTVEGVDLRYRVEDEYHLPASGAEPIVFQVKSTDKWMVYSLHGEEQWCTITPSKGEGGETADVEVKYADNIELDDRVDTLVIQSDYWIGKWVTIYQKGTAFLTSIGEDEEWIDKAGASKTFCVESNQNWSVEISEGKDWLTLESEVEGAGNGTFVVKALPNKGAVRTAKISLYDRHLQVQQVVECTQEGILLQPEAADLKMAYGEKEGYTLNVKSNTCWTVEKENPDDNWFTLGETSFENDGTWTVAVTENDTQRARNATLIIRTVPSEDGTIIEEKIVLKQIYKPFAIHWEFSKEMFPAGNGTTGWMYDSKDGSPIPEMKDGDMHCAATGGYSRILRYGQPSGMYTLKLKPMEGGAKTGFWFTVGSGSGKTEFRFHLDADSKKLEASNNKKYKMKQNIKTFNPNIANEIKVMVEKGSGSSAKVSYYLNGELAAQCTEKKVKKYTDPITLYIGAQKGTIIYDWMEFTDLVTIDDLE